MKKGIVAALLISSGAYALEHVNVPHTFQDSALIIASEFNENFDMLKQHHNNLVDTVDAKFLRKSAIESGDTVLNNAVIKKLTGVDSIRGGPVIDSIVVEGAIKTDSVYSTTGVKAARLRGDVIGGTISGTTGTFSSRLSADSVYSTTGVKAARLHGDVIGGTIRGTTGTFSSTLVADSVYSTGGIKASSIRLGGWSAIAQAYSGWSSISTWEGHYKVVDDIVFVRLRISGTSNSAAATITMPYSAPVSFKFLIPLVYDNGVRQSQPGYGVVLGDYLNLYKTVAEDPWTNSGTKGFECVFWYIKQ